MRATATERARLLLAELVGTFTLVFVGCGAIMVDAEADVLGQVGTALAFGLAIAVMICAVGHVSGAHFNPAVTLAFALRRDFPWSLVPGYWIAQVLGALAAALLLRGSLGDVADVGTTQPAGSQGEAFLWEVVLTFLLLFVITAVATGSVQGLPLGAAVAVGGTIAMASLVGGPVSGASLNPARSLAPALVSGNLNALWLYLVAPLVGGALGAFAYEFLRRG